MGPSEPQLPRGSDDAETSATTEAVQRAIAEAEIAASPGKVRPAVPEGTPDTTDPEAPTGQ